jgi:cytochrome c oxidase assembly protein subunit 15
LLSDWLLAPSTTAIRRWALGGLVTSILIILTGAAVRLSQSGLGCTNWPNCTATSLVASGATGDSLAHRWIEFGNRLVTVTIFVVAIGVFAAAWQYRADGERRRDLVWLAVAQPAAIVVQALLGGIVVLTKLNPALVSLHFLASIALVAAAVALYVRCQEGRGPARALAPRPVQLTALGLVGAVALMMSIGTVVTGTGPLAGAPDVARYRLPLEGVTQLHADIGWLLGGLVVALLLGLRLGKAPHRAVRLGWLLAGLIVLQGVIGYAQYFSGLPAGLVWVHVTGSTAIWVAALFLPYALRDRSAQPSADRPRPAAEADRGAALPH